MKCCHLLFLSYVSIALYWMESKLPTCVANLRLLDDAVSALFTPLLGLGLTEQGDQKRTPPLTGVMTGQGIQI